MEMAENIEFTIETGKVAVVGFWMSHSSQFRLFLHFRLERRNGVEAPRGVQEEDGRTRLTATAVTNCATMAPA